MICPLCKIDRKSYDEIYDDIIACHTCFDKHQMKLRSYYNSSNELAIEITFEGVVYTYDEWLRILKLKAFL